MNNEKENPKTQESFSNQGETNNLSPYKVNYPPDQQVNMASSEESDVRPKSVTRIDPYQLSKPSSANAEAIVGIIFIAILLGLIFYASSRFSNLNLGLESILNNSNYSDELKVSSDTDDMLVEEVSIEEAFRLSGITMNVPSDWKAEVIKRENKIANTTFISSNLEEYSYISIIPYEHSIPDKSNFLELSKNYSGSLYEDSKYSVILDQPVNINGLDGHYVIYRYEYKDDTQDNNPTYSYALYLYKDEITGYRIFGNFNRFKEVQADFLKLDDVIRSFKISN